jgi:hypothetical protein
LAKIIVWYFSQYFFAFFDNNAQKATHFFAIFNGGEKWGVFLNPWRSVGEVFAEKCLQTREDML